MHVDGARVAVLRVAPDVLEQGLAGEHPAGGAGEGAEDLELDVGDADLPRRPRVDLAAAIEVDLRGHALDRDSSFRRGWVPIIRERRRAALTRLRNSRIEKGLAM